MVFIFLCDFTFRCRIVNSVLKYNNLFHEPLRITQQQRIWAVKHDLKKRKVKKHYAKEGKYKYNNNHLNY